MRREFECERNALRDTMVGEIALPAAFIASCFAFTRYSMRKSIFGACATAKRWRQCRRFHVGRPNAAAPSVGVAIQPGEARRLCKDCFHRRNAYAAIVRACVQAKARRRSGRRWRTSWSRG
ncbi:hypothetical protein Bphy_4799 [Paraburkholderia phymatum STM815]|uniref:Uncharacterized protein n=1 Tax=Paraburkholderia phymatum (strain DSM 17167 / CIP 108236 / LMG 21445 / STM815) TaxID=391038 RepID=B2JRY8_PARP8|nr:hypothetical protein Bphy_4799 [Paraburkholderia phymatum STM815]